MHHPLIRQFARLCAVPPLLLLLPLSSPNCNRARPVPWNKRKYAMPLLVPACAIVEHLNREMLAALAQPDIREKFEEFGIDARGGTPENLRDLLASEIAKWKPVVDSTGIEKQ